MSPKVLPRTSLVPDTERWLRERIDDGVLFGAAQVAVVHQNRLVVDLAVGREGMGREIGPSTQFRVYCAGKPLLAAVVCRAAERGLLDRSAQLSRFRSGLDAALGDVRIDDLFHHQTPFTQPSGFGSVFIPKGTRSAAVVRMCEGAMRSLQPNGYSEVANWLLLAEALAWTTGRPWQTLVTEHCEDVRLPMAELSVSTDALGRSHRSGSVGVNVRMRDGRCMPLLGEVTGSLAERLDGPGFGPVCSTRLLTRLVADSVLNRGYGAATGARTVISDRMYGRNLSFSDGLMVGTDTLGISDLWPEDVAGHNGIAGMTLVFASPSLELAVGIHLNGLMGPEDGGEHVRPFLTALLHSELVGGLGLA